MEQENKREENIRVIRDYKIASYLVNKGYKIVNIKRHRNYICEITNLKCDKRTVFAFLIEGNFLADLEYAKEFYDDLKKEEQ